VVGLQREACETETGRQPYTEIPCHSSPSFQQDYMMIILPPDGLSA
jgi:hypothetical protein